MTYTTLQTLTTNPQSNAPVASYVPGDDVSVANRLAETYNAMGLDPSAAFDSPEDALGDFGNTFR